MKCKHFLHGSHEKNKDQNFEGQIYSGGEFQSNDEIYIGNGCP